MMKGLLFVIFCFYQSVSFAADKWIVDSEDSDIGVVCATPRVVSSGHWWSFCDGNASNHGEVRVLNSQNQTIFSNKISSIDRLSLLRSVSASSQWQEYKSQIYVGTQDGRLLRFGMNAELKSEQLIENFHSIKILAIDEESVWALSEGTKDSYLLKLNHDLVPAKKTLIPHTHNQVEVVASDGQFYVATDKGHIVVFDKALNLTHDLGVSSGRSLGAPLVSENKIWVGDEGGMFHQLDLLTGKKESTLVGHTSLTLAPIKVSSGVWLAVEEEGQLWKFDENGRVQKKVKIPYTRSFLIFSSHFFQQQNFLSVASHGHFALLNEQGEILVKLARPGKELHLGASILGDKLVVAESQNPLKWRLRPLHLPSLSSHRSPAQR